MNKVNYPSLQRIAKAIKTLDEVPKTENTLNSDTNVWRVEEARRHLMNTLFNCGYELQYKTYRVIKSTNKRALIKPSREWQK